MIALAAMKPSVAAVFYAVAVVLFIVSFFRTWAVQAKTRYDFAALGLALFVFVFCWNAVAAA